jgi:hypothetical protein
MQWDIHTCNETYIHAMRHTYMQWNLHTCNETYIHAMRHTYMQWDIHTCNETYMQCLVTRWHIMQHAYLHTYAHVCMHAYIHTHTGMHNCRFWLASCVEAFLRGSDSRSQVCMYICMLYACVYIPLYVCVHIHLYLCTHICAYLQYAHTHARACNACHIWICGCTHDRTCIRMLKKHIHAHAYIHTYIQIHMCICRYL